MMVVGSCTAQKKAGQTSIPGIQEKDIKEIDGFCPFGYPGCDHPGYRETRMKRGPRETDTTTCPID